MPEGSIPLLALGPPVKDNKKGKKRKKRGEEKGYLRVRVLWRVGVWLRGIGKSRLWVGGRRI